MGLVLDWRSSGIRSQVSGIDSGATRLPPSLKLRRDKPAQVRRFGVAAIIPNAEARERFKRDFADRKRRFWLIVTSSRLSREGLVRRGQTSAAFIDYGEPRMSDVRDLREELRVERRREVISDQLQEDQAAFLE